MQRVCFVFCLVCADPQADFGNSTKIPDGKKWYKLKRAMKISMKWAAPESVRAKKFNQRTDVWSYGVTAWEILSCV
jgi:serine/threonine protein kinase